MVFRTQGFQLETHWDKSIPSGPQFVHLELRGLEKQNCKPFSGVASSTLGLAPSLSGALVCLCKVGKEMWGPPTLLRLVSGQGDHRWESALSSMKERSSINPRGYYSDEDQRGAGG